MRQHFTDPNTDKIIILKVYGHKLISESGKSGGKLRTTEKAFADTEQAMVAFEKKVWASLKKGYIHHNPNAQVGEPILHRFISRGYTGALAFAETPKGYFVYECGEYNDKTQSDFMQQISGEGVLINRFQLPKILAWQMKYDIDNERLKLNLDHHLYQFSLSDFSFEKDKKKIKLVSPCGNYWTESNYDFLSEKNNGKIHIYHSETDGLKATIESGFKKVKRVDLTDNYLIANDYYWDGGMKFFDLATLKEVSISGLEIAERFPLLMDFCLSADQKYLAQRRGAFIYVSDFHKQKFLYKFKIEHLVKSCEISFVSQGLAIRTDYGCFSVYRIW